MKRQGDLLIVRVDRLPIGARRIARRILAEGEATGHLHELDCGQVYEKNGGLYFSVLDSEEAILSHPEHGPLQFERGLWKVIRQREYDPEVHERYVRD